MWETPLPTMLNYCDHTSAITKFRIITTMVRSTIKADAQNNQSASPQKEWLEYITYIQMENLVPLMKRFTRKKFLNISNRMRLMPIDYE